MRVAGHRSRLLPAFLDAPQRRTGRADIGDRDELSGFLQQLQELSRVRETVYIMALWDVRWYRYAYIGNSVAEDALDSLA